MTRFITATFASRCLKCGQSVAVGQRVAWTKGVGVEHATCPEPEASPVPVIASKLAPLASKLSPQVVDVPASSPHSFGRDAILPLDVEAQHSTRTAPLAEVLKAWREQIAAEQISDVEIVNWRSPTPELGSIGLYLRTTDGALMVGPSAWGFTPRAWTGTVNLLLAETPNRPPGAAAVGAWLSPETRSIVFEELKARSKRREDAKHPLFVRTYIDRAFPTIRTVRAVLSGRHSGTHFDDGAVADVLAKTFSESAPAYVSRGVNTTAGRVTLAEGSGLAAQVHFANSETGARSLDFSGGAYITAIGASITVPDARREVLITSAKGRATLRHTLPRVNVTEIERAKVAGSRLAQQIDASIQAATGLVDAWGAALVSFPQGLTSTAASVGSPARAEWASVVVDAIVERCAIKAPSKELVERLTACVATNKPLADSGLPVLSAAWVAATFALLAADEQTADGFRTRADEAGRWVVDGWRRGEPLNVRQSARA